MPQTRITDFDRFWSFYVLEHEKPATRVAHVVGTTTGALVVVLGLVTGTYWLIPVGLVAGYGPAWISHFFIEGNNPASFRQPLYSFLADWKMWAYMIVGRMDAEVARAQAYYRDIDQDLAEPV